MLLVVIVIPVVFVIVMIVLTIAVTITAVPFVVPVVVMFKPASVPLPVTLVISFSIMMRRHPPCAVVGWSSPITVVPLVMPSDRIPITVYPYVLRAWSWRLNTDHTGWRRRANLDSNRDLSKC